MKFTIIIPTYNYGHYISDCLNSVIQQSYHNWECIIIDNASTDNTKSICETFLSDKRFAYHTLTENKGPSFARNYALKMARGSFVLFLDSDDLIESQKLESAASLIHNYKCDFVFSNYTFFNSEDKSIIKTVTFSHYFDAYPIKARNISNLLIKENLFAISCIISNLDILKQVNYFDESLAYNEDWDLWLRVSFKETLYFYDTSNQVSTLIRNHSTSHSKDRFAMYLAGLVVCKKNLSLLDNNQKRIFEEKIVEHLHTLKLMLVEFYYTDKLKFSSSIKKMLKYPILNKDLSLYRKEKWLLTKFFSNILVTYLKVKYYIISKCC